MYTKTRGHHCWWLRKDNKEIANFDENNEHVIDDILKMQEVNADMYKYIERISQLRDGQMHYAIDWIIDNTDDLIKLLEKARGE
jgi:hypothetical protein